VSSAQVADLSAGAGGFLIGSLLQVPLEVLGQRVQAGYAAAGLDDLRPAHSVVFRTLAPAGERVTELAARAHTTKQAMGYLVDYLVQHGYLERLPDPTDGRAQIVRRTERGWEANRVAREVVGDVQAEWAAMLGEARLDQLLTLLIDLASRLGARYAGSISEVSAASTPPAAQIGPLRPAGLQTESLHS
jgi:DNA-binding MarR family transcriptional regulator